jgi:hypothetical protein
MKRTGKNSGTGIEYLHLVFSALACADVLLTLDRRDFRDLLGQTIYGLRVLTPGDFLRIEREAGPLR